MVVNHTCWSLCVEYCRAPVLNSETVIQSSHVTVALSLSLFLATAAVYLSRGATYYMSSWSSHYASLLVFSRHWSCLFAHEVTSSGTGARSMLLGLLSLHDVAASGSIIVYSTSIPFSISNQKELPVHLELVY
jgi:hypothetical protein